jgi:rod shape-determining protein MreC
VAKRRSSIKRAGAQRNGLVIAFAAVLIVAAVGAITFRVGVGSGPAHSAMEAGDDVAGEAGRVATAPARAGGDLFSRIGAMWTAAKRVKELEAEVRALQEWRSQALRLAERNARYETLLRMPAEQFGAGADIGEAIAAQLVLDSGGAFTRTLVANAGADHGVQTGFVALNQNGLIGRVVSVGQRSSRVMTLDDYNSRIPVMGETSRVRAIMVGNATLPPDLLTRPFTVESPRLDFIVGATSLREGERIITSGDGGVFPRGLHVGVAHHGADGAWRVSLAASQLPIDFVRLIPFIEPRAPEEEAAVAEQAPAPRPRAQARDVAVAQAPASPAPIVIETTAAPTPPAAAVE